MFVFRWVILGAGWSLIPGDRRAYGPRGIWVQAHGETAMGRQRLLRTAESKSRGLSARPGAEGGKEGPPQVSEGARLCQCLHLRPVAPRRRGHAFLSCKPRSVALCCGLLDLMHVLFSLSAQTAVLSVGSRVAPAPGRSLWGSGPSHPWLRHIEGPALFAGRRERERPEGVSQGL